jgi:N-hydroxyarylamine O-acetyltransferase
MAEAVLERLGFDDRPTADAQGLAALYEAWGQRVPWDCVRKRLYFSSSCTGPLPGSTAEEFFTGWLADGTGGTCWAGSIAWHGLLSALGFDARFGSGQVQRDRVEALAPIPNHGTTIVRFGNDDVIVDSSFLTREPVPLPPVADDRTFRFAPFHDAGGRFWRIVLDDVPRELVDAWHEATRATSPFNRFLNARRNDGDEVVGWSFGHGVRLRTDGTVEHDDGGRKPWLVDVLGYSEAIVDRIPDDEVA